MLDVVIMSTAFDIAIFTFYGNIFEQASTSFKFVLPSLLGSLETKIITSTTKEFASEV